MSNFSQRAWPRRLRACAPAVSMLAALAGCGGSSGGSMPQIELTATGSASTASVQRGDTATFSFDVSNPGQATVDAVVATPLPDSNLSVQGVTCTAQGGTCPATSTATQATFSMPPGSVFTFTVTAKELADLDGTVTMTLAVDSTQRLGEVRASAQAASVDSRDGWYALQEPSGLEGAADLGFNPATPSFSRYAIEGSSTPEVTMKSQADYFTLSPAGHLSTGADVVVGADDFGAGQESFIGTRNDVTDLASLDGVSFTTFNLPEGGVASAGSSVHGLSGPLGIWQASIAGSTLTMCTDSIGAIATCSPTGLRHYALAPTWGLTGRFDANDSVDGDFFTFEVARSGASLIWLRDAYGSDGQPYLFSVGLANTQPPAEEHDAYATLDGKFGVLVITSTSWEFLAQNPAGDFGSSAVFPFTAGSDDGVPGLLHGPRPSDGVEVYMAHQGALTLVGTLTGEFSIALDKP